jgi:D-3-phosphoglycerate dehydrogenase
LANYVHAGSWKRITGHELMGSTLGIVGLGRIGKEVALRAKAFGMNLVGYGHYWEDDFAASVGMKRCQSLDELIAAANIITLHTKLTDESRGMFDAKRLNNLRPDTVIVNCARGELLDTNALVAALASGKLAGYAADVMDQEPPAPDHPLLKAKNCIITPHVGSRTHENVQRQATMAVENIVRFFRGEKPLAQANVTK